MKLKPAACYLRCSTDLQEESIPEQRKQIEQHARSLGYEIVDEFADDGISGTTTDRQGLQAFLEACENGAPWDTAFVWDRKRLGRPKNPIDLLTITSRIAKSGKKLTFLHGAQTTGDGMVDGIIEFIEFGQAGKESVDKSRDVLRGQHFSAKAGAFSGGRTPYGTDSVYMAGDKPMRRVRYVGRRKLEVSPDGKEVLRELPKGKTHMPGEWRTYTPGAQSEVAVVRRLYREYGAGASVRSLCLALNNDRIPSPRGGKWCQGTIKAILSNPLYKGDLAWNRTTSSKFHRLTAGGKIIKAEERDRFRASNPEEEWVTVEGAWEGLVTVEEWEAVSARLKNAHKTPRALRGKGAKSVHLAAGLMHCACGHVFSGTTNRKNGRSYRLYRCGGREYGPSVCKAKSIKAGLIDDYLKRRITELYHGPALSTRMWEEVTRQLDGALDALFDARARRDPGKELAEVEAKTARVVDAIADGLLSRAEADEKLTHLREERKRLQAAKRDPIAGIDRLTLRNRILDSARARMSEELTVWETGTPMQRKHVVRAHLNAIYVDEPKSTIRVEFLPLQFRIQNSSGTSSTSTQPPPGTPRTGARRRRGSGAVWRDRLA